MSHGSSNVVFVRQDKDHMRRVGDCFHEYRLVRGQGVVKRAHWWWVRGGFRVTTGAAWVTVRAGVYQHADLIRGVVPVLVLGGASIANAHGIHASMCF